ncbi:MAG: BTAD domain-containing putative transcriptional regulator [Caldilineaceae bacterium]
MSILQLQLLGSFQIRYNDEPVTGVNQARLQSLLAYLALHRNAPQARRHLAFLFWPDSTEAQAHANLRQLLHRLQHALPDADQFLRMDGKTVQWRPDAPCTLDVAEFEAALTRAQAALRAQDEASAQVALQTAVVHYHGDLLLGCYEEWVLAERERWREAYLKALEQLILLLETRRDYPAAIDYAQRLLRHDPLHETTYGHLMRLHVLHGDPASALRVYHTCATFLQRELGVNPNPQIQAAYEQLLKREVSPALPATGRTPFQQEEPLIGRQAEWQKVLAAWRLTAGGQAHLLVVAGEAGIGKTRLAEELMTWVDRQGIRTAHTRSYAAEGALAYAPVAEWLRSETLRASWQALATIWLTELARILPELLVEQPHLPHPEPLQESWQRKRLFEALARAVLLDNHPLLLVLDDLQWCDHETLAWLHYLLRYAPQTPLLIVGTVRPEEVNHDHPLTNLLLDLRSTAQVTEMELGPLTLDETTTLAAQVTRQNLSTDLAQRLYQETEGNPLFVVETARAEHRDQRLETGDPVSHNLRSLVSDLQSLPPKVYAVIQRRLAQLSPAAREVASLAAVIGRSFTFAVLAQASDLAEDALVRGLDELWQRRIAREQGNAAYDFSHDRIRDVAYATISPVRRRWLHRRVAQSLETLHAGDLDTVSGQIAVHYEQASLFEQAIPYFQRAAEVAQRTFAHADAVHDLTKGLALLAQLPVTTEQMRQELGLQLALALSFNLLRGPSDHEMRLAYERAEALSIQASDHYRRMVALCGQFVNAVTGARLQEARRLAEQAYILAQELGNPRWQAETHGMLGVALVWLGEWVASRHCLEDALVGYNVQPDNTLTLFHDQPIELTHRRHLAKILWFLGYPDQALQQMNETMRLAQAITHPYSLANIYIYSALVYQHRGEAQLMQAPAKTVTTLSQQYGYSAYLLQSLVLTGWALVQQGQHTEGIAQMEAGFAVRQTSRVQLHLPPYLALIAEAYGQIGQPAEGLRVVDEALTIVEATEERFAEVELYRMKGELLQMQGATVNTVAVYFQKAIDTARRQQAKSLELRAALSLARLWQQQGKRTQAYDLLADIYGWFTEGFDTRDLQEAKALLAELS